MTYVKSVLYNFTTVRNHYLNRLEIHKVYHRLHGNVSHLYEVRETSITPTLSTLLVKYHEPINYVERLVRVCLFVLHIKC